MDSNINNEIRDVSHCRLPVQTLHKTGSKIANRE